jgi:octopine/nopaline transport system permease protein
MEMTGPPAKLISQSYRAIEVFVAADITYLALNFLISRAVLALEWWPSPHLRIRQISQSPSTHF